MIGKVLHSILTNNNLFNGVSVGPLRTFQALPFPSVTYMVSGNSPSSIKNGVSPLDEVEFTINVFSKSYAQCNELGEMARYLIDRYNGTVEGVVVQSIEYVGQDDLYDDGAMVYGIALDFIARVVRSSPVFAVDYAAADYSKTDYKS